jgi:excisionase family DNA binding protein
MYLTVKEIAERLRVSPVTVKRIIADGQIPAVRIGSQSRVEIDDFEAYLKRSKNVNDCVS